MKLNEIRDNQGATQARKRLGRGAGSGLGKTSGRGGKGQTARSGVSIRGFEGGQNPIYRRLPKRGFSNAAFRADIAEVNFYQLEQAIQAQKIDPKKVITRALLLELGFMKNRSEGIKLLAKGELTTPIQIEVTAASKSAIATVEKLKGKVILPAVKDKE